MAKIISIVSGKGGAGKSLLTAVIGRALGREGKDVLIVDLDIFVRGLTVLLYSFRAPSVDKKLTVSDLLGVFSEGSQYRGPIDLDIGSDLTIEKFLEVDVLPSVERINFPLDYDDRSLSDEGFCISVLKAMIKKVEGSYDYIFLDNRAGMDSLVSASCRVSNVVLSVAEDDEVARQTDYNLVQFLQNKKIAPSVYSIVNKGRNITRAHQIDDASNSRHNFGSLGSIPFDIEILNGFGSTHFWDSIFSSIYFYGVIRAWNKLAEIESLDNITKSKYQFPPMIFMAEAAGRYSTLERILRLYGIVASIAGIVFIFYKRNPDFFTDDPSLLVGIATIVLGVFALFLSTSDLEQFLGNRRHKGR